MLSIVLVVVLSLTAVHGDSDHHHHLTFADFMKHVQVNYDLTDPNLLLLGELVMAVDDHTLKAQIDRLGFKNVIKLLQHLDDTDAHYFENYLYSNLGYTRDLSVNKRDRHGDLNHWLSSNTNHPNEWFDHLPQHIQNIFKTSRARRAFTGYSNLSGAIADEFESFLIKHLEEEKTTASHSA